MASDDDLKPLGGVSQDTIAGLVVAAVACLAIYKGYALDIGTLAEVGPGLFPAALGTVLLALSLALVAKGFVSAPKEGLAMPGRWGLRALGGILGALAVFGLLIKGMSFGPVAVPALGLSGATPLAVLVAGLADRETRWGELALFAAGLTVFCVLLFRFALSLPLPLAPWLIGY